MPDSGCVGAGDTSCGPVGFFFYFMLTITGTLLLIWALIISCCCWRNSRHKAAAAKAAEAGAAGTADGDVAVGVPIGEVANSNLEGQDNLSQ